MAKAGFKLGFQNAAAAADEPESEAAKQQKKKEPGTSPGESQVKIDTFVVCTCNVLCLRIFVFFLLLGSDAEVT